jgi:hypothetical protein
MRIDITYLERNWFIGHIKWWFFYYKPYGLIKGFNLRLFGWHFNIRENNGFNKIIATIKK